MGTYRGIAVAVSDGKRRNAWVALPAFSVTVEAAARITNRPPLIGGAPAGAVVAGSVYSFAPLASDPDGDTLTFSISNLPAWATFNTATGRLSGTPGSHQIGTYSGITISATDGTASATLPPFAITVASSNRAPTISGVPTTSTTAGQAYSFQPTASDPDGDTLSYSIVNRPTWATFSSSSGRLSGTPGSSQVGTYSGITISASDGTASVTLPPFGITVATGNRAPVLSGTPATSVAATQAYAFQPTATDADGDTLTFSIANMPTWATFSTATGRLSGTPGSNQVGTYSGITISASDGRASSSLPPFAITVASSNRAPTISGVPATSTTAGQAYSFQPTASDPDGDALTYSIVNRPAWATFSSSSGRLSGTPGATDVATYGNVTISASDGTASATLPPFAITVASSNRAPTISGVPTTSTTAGQAYSFQPTASDPDGDTLTYSIANRPTWATFSSATGRLSGTPGSSFAGLTFSGITISVSDGLVTSALPQFAITVATGNRAPVLSGTPATSVAATQAYAFQPTATDADGDTLTFSIANMPTWATFSTATGRLSGTPGSNQVGTYSSITISASDGTTSATLPPFAITVASSNRAPTISGVPPTSAIAGQAYSFQPTASDPDGNTLTYAIVNRPAWATFSNSSGRLSGTPGATDVATYGNVTISVSDGTATASLPSFSIAVMGSSNGSATLSWTAPTMNTDGSPLTDLAGFRIHYGQASRQYSESVEIPSAGVTSVVIENLVPATWYFSVRAFTATGAESDLSSEAYKTIM